MSNLRSRRVHVLWREQAGLYRGYLVDVATALGVGILLVASGRRRTSGPSFALVNNSGGPAVWGTALVLAGALLIVAGQLSPRAVTWAMWLLALIYLVLALSFLVSAAHDLTGRSSFAWSVLATYVAFTHVSRAQSYRDGPQWTA